LKISKTTLKARPMKRTIPSLLFALSVGTAVSVLLPQSASAGDYHQDSGSSVIIVDRDSYGYDRRYESRDRDEDCRDNRDYRSSDRNYRHSYYRGNRVWVPGYWEKAGRFQTSRWVEGRWEYRRYR
jgi:hypothetical protein